MSTGGKGSARRPGAMPDGNWERIFRNITNENVIPPDQPKDGAPTDDGPGQPEARDFERRRFER